MFDLVIRGGTVVAGDGSALADVAIEGERIAAVGHRLPARREVDAAGCLVIPGGVDQHVHLQLALAGRVSSDSFATGTVAAACGGTTTVIDFAEPKAGQSMLDALAARRREADGAVALDYGLHMTTPAWHAAEMDRLDEIEAVVAAGCPTFKAYQAYGALMLDDGSLLRVMQRVGRAGGRLALHSETGPVLDLLRAQALAAGHLEPIWHAHTRPARLEATAVARAIELAHLAGCRLLIFHVGCAESVAAIAAAQTQGAPVQAETCPQYLLLTAAEHLDGPEGELYVCAPPLRTRADQDVLWRSLASGVLNIVSTDHCPWTRAEKTQPDFTQILGGVPSIEARLALLYHYGVAAGRLTPERWVELCCTNPARLMGLARKGRLAPGYDADIVIFDPQRPHPIDVTTLHETAGWTPYAGMTVQGWPRTVLLRGRVIVDGGRYVGSQGDGRFVARTLAV
jgi:dihydropyrimidinase